jgi:hypothetical protein
MSDEAHAAELAIVRAQRDALAGVVAKVWNDSRDGFDVGDDVIEASMMAAGLAETWTATEAGDDHEAGDDLIELSAFGRAALAGAKPP